MAILSALPIGSASAEVLSHRTFVAAEDAHVIQENPNTNYARSSKLETGGSGVAPTRESYVKFNVRGVSGAIAEAKVRVFSTASADGPAIASTSHVSVSTSG